MYKKCTIRKTALLLVAIAQLAVLVVYWSERGGGRAKPTRRVENVPVRFIDSRRNQTRPPRRFYTADDRVVLDTKGVDDDFEDFNSSLCYKLGTDVKVMRKSKDPNWKCVCQPGWHGNDCGQPEVIWRALLALRKRTVPTLRKTQRRLVAFHRVDVASETFTEITLLELRTVVDLFVITGATRELGTELARSDITNVLLVDSPGSAWRSIANLRDNDLLFVNGPYEVPNAGALRFLKLYDGWPEPLTFRLKWNVYGFFWRHPGKTVLTSGPCTSKYLYDAHGHDVATLKRPPDNPRLIIGDLNHFGGWFCEYCNEPALIIKSLNLSSADVSLSGRGINVEVLEDFIENGVYIDGKTSLGRVYRSRENYYAPSVVGKSNWRYDWLVMNLYSKMDYY